MTERVFQLLMKGRKKNLIAGKGIESQGTIWKNIIKIIKATFKTIDKH